MEVKSHNATTYNSTYVHRRPCGAPRAMRRCGAPLRHMAPRPGWTRGHVTYAQHVMQNGAKSAFRNQLDNIQVLYVHYLHEAEHMSTVNISFNPDLLRQIDEVAQEESRSRSELLREAARAYIERKRRWAQIFKIGAQTAKSRGITPEDLEQEIRSYRASQQK